MSGAHDETLVYPDEQEKIQRFEVAYNHYRQNIRKYLSLKLNPMVADDLTQQVFLKAMENIHTFNENSSIFTWIFKIAENTVKNEYRRCSRNKEIVFDFLDYEPSSVALDFDKHIEIRIDISSALKKLSALDQEIISLRFFVDCTLPEISKIVGMRESAVKNRLYRSLEKLRRSLREWGDITIMSIQEMVSIVSMNEAGRKDYYQKVYRDLFNELKANVERIVAKYNHQPSQKIIIEIYPDLHSFHQAVGEDDAPNWFMGTYEGNRLKIVSPLNPGPEHTYQSILKSTIHLFAVWLINDINPLVPKWLGQGIGGYEAGQMTQEFIIRSTSDAIKNSTIPSLQELTDDSWDFETKKGFQFSYLIVDFIIEKYGLDDLNKLIRNPVNFSGIFHRAESELYEQWVGYLRAL